MGIEFMLSLSTKTANTPWDVNVIIDITIDQVIPRTIVYIMLIS